jgi:hypothetical protein
LSGHHVFIPYKLLYVTKVGGDVRSLGAVAARDYGLLWLDTFFLHVHIAAEKGILNPIHIHNLSAFLM